MIQSFELAALTHVRTALLRPECRTHRLTVSRLISPDATDATTVACTLRRSSSVFHLFAATVALELFWSEASNGARNINIYTLKRLEEKRVEAALVLIRALSELQDLPIDTVGMPLMRVRGSMCVARGVLVVTPGGTSATYVLELADGEDAADLAQLRSIRVLRVVQ